MTLEWIINRLKTNGKGTKQEVLQALENATDKDLHELLRSINSELTKRVLTEYYQEKHQYKKEIKKDGNYCYSLVIDELP